MKASVENLENIGCFYEEAYNKLINVFDELKNLSYDWEIKDILNGKEECLINYYLFLTKIVFYLRKITVYIKYQHNKLYGIKNVLMNDLKNTEEILKIEIFNDNNDIKNNFKSYIANLQSLINECECEEKNLENDIVILNENIIQLKDLVNLSTNK